MNAHIYAQKKRMRKETVLELNKEVEEEQKKEKNPSLIRKLILDTLPQAGAFKSYAPTLSQMYLILGLLRDLVKMSASWSFELTKLVATHPDAIFSVLKCQSTSICSVLS